MASFVEKYPTLPEGESLSGSLTLSALEPPSAIAALERLVPGLEVRIESVPKPDARTPRRPVTHRIWKYQGRHAVVAVPAPSPQAVELLHTVARRWWPHPVAAYDQAVGLAGLPLDDLLGLLGHVPGRPRDDAEWAMLHREIPALWPRFAQAWTCLGIAHHQTDEPWANSTRRTVLLDLADGPEDWVCDAALNAMVAIAWVDPQIRHDVAVAVANRFLDAVEVASHRQITILRSLAHLTLAAPQMPEEATSLARKLLERRDGTRPRRLRRLFGRS
jgi:hypothetical protein